MASRRAGPLDAVVVGAGAAGLAAARGMSEAGLRIVVLEARARIGGRILTLRDPGWPVPVELGAEFLHGKAPATRAVAEAAGLALVVVPERHEWKRPSGRRERPDVWGELSSVQRRVRSGRPDLSMEALLGSQRRLDARVRDRVRALVEGYEAAPAGDISAQSLAARPDDGDANGQARLRDGQDGLVRWLRAGLDPDRAPLHLSTIVESVAWSPGQATVRARTGPAGRAHEWQACSVVLTVPIGVLAAASGPGAIRFTPRLGSHAAAIAGFGMGQALKLTFRLRRPLWDERTAFLHDSQAQLPTWWTQTPVHVPVVTAWAGGPRAQALADQGAEAVLRAALDSLRRVFGRGADREVEAWSGHDWGSDPFSRGTYSYVRVGGVAARRRLARPVAGTIHFAGEALDEDEAGTVNGALASGVRAARQVVRRLGG